jgi:ABC-type molybdate transport system substrate-binding protein
MKITDMLHIIHFPNIHREYHTRSQKDIRTCLRMQIARCIAGMVIFIFFAGCGKSEKCTVFQAAFFSPVMRNLGSDAEKATGMAIVTETGGSKLLCRKISELGRQCDVVVLADAKLFPLMLSRDCSWRIDFAKDRLVLAIGTRAKHTDLAEKDWIKALLMSDVVICRADEKLAPLGQRTLKCWSLAEKMGHPGLAAKLSTRCKKIVEDAEHVSALLKSGDCDYAFLYRSSCVEQDIRYIEINSAINMSSGIDAIVYALSIPDKAEHRIAAERFIQFLLNDEKDILTEAGLSIHQIDFYGPREKYDPFKNCSVYAGENK